VTHATTKFGGMWQTHQKTAGAAVHTSRRLAVDNRMEPAIIAGYKLQSRKALYWIQETCAKSADHLRNGRLHEGVYWCYRLPIFLRVAQE